MSPVLQKKSHTWARRCVTWCFLRKTLQRLNPSLPPKPLTEQCSQPFLHQHLYFQFLRYSFSHCLVSLWMVKRWFVHVLAHVQPEWGCGEALVRKEADGYTWGLSMLSPKAADWFFLFVGLVVLSLYCPHQYAKFALSCLSSSSLYSLKEPPSVSFCFTSKIFSFL